MAGPDMAGPVEAKPTSTVLVPSAGAQKGSTMDDLGVRDPFSGVAGIDDQLSFLDDAAIVVVGVVGHDKNTVILPQILQLGSLHLQVVFAAFTDKREIGIMIADLRPVLLEQFD